MYPTPYSNNMLRHPLFRHEVRHVRWGFSDERIRGYSLRVFLVALVINFLAWLLLSLAFSTPPPFSYYQQSAASWFVYGSGQQVFALLVFASIGVNLLLDFASTFSGLKSINSEVSAGRWDLLRLTALREEGIVNAKHAAAQVRAWRMMAVTVSIRGVSIILGLFIFAIVPLLVLRDGSFFTGVGQTLLREPLGTLLAFITLVLTLVVYVVEPYWRIKAMTALGMVVSSYVLNTPLATLAGVGAIFAVWLAQIIIVAMLVFGLGFLLSPTIFLFSSNVAFSILYGLVAAVITAATIYGFYTLLQNWGLRRVTARIYKSN